MRPARRAPEPRAPAHENRPSSSVPQPRLYPINVVRLRLPPKSGPDTARHPIHFWLPWPRLNHSKAPPLPELSAICKPHRRQGTVMFGLRIFSLDHTLSRIRVSLLGTHQTIFCKTPPGLRFMYLTTFMSQAALQLPRDRDSLRSVHDRHRHKIRFDQRIELAAFGRDKHAAAGLGVRCEGTCADGLNRSDWFRDYALFALCGKEWWIDCTPIRKSPLGCEAGGESTSSEFAPTASCQPW